MTAAAGDPLHQSDYLRRRLKAETQAALRAPDPLSASIHVRLATHYAKSLIEELGAAPALRSPTT